MDEDGLLIRSLSQLRTEVAAYPFWERMENSWTESLCQMCRAMLCEKYWALGYSLLGSSVLPTHAAYMDWAWRSIGVWPMLQTMMITTADASLLEREPELTRLIRSCSVAVRLSNDLRSDAKERQEGGINALRIAENEPTGCGEPVVASPHSQVSRRMVRAISDLHELVRRSARAVDPSVESIGRTGQLLCEFYAHRDYHWSDTEPSWADSHEPRPSGTLDEGLKSAVGNVTGLCS